MKLSTTKRWFDKLAGWTARASGRPMAFVLAVLVVLVWLITGPFYDYSETWQLVINTGTTIVTFLMIFLIQNTQNRDAAAIQLKLDEIIRAIRPADNALLNAEDLGEEELDRLRAHYRKIAEKAKDKLEAVLEVKTEEAKREVEEKKEEAKREVEQKKEEVKCAVESKKPKAKKSVKA